MSLNPPNPLKGFGGLLAPHRGMVWFLTNICMGKGAKKKVFFCELAVHLGGGVSAEERSGSLSYFGVCPNTGIFFILMSLPLAARDQIIPRVIYI